MKNKKNWLGILIIALVFGMTVFGCEEDDPELPFWLWIEITGGTHSNPLVGNILTATSSQNGYGTPTWQWYRGDTAIGGANSNKYTVVNSDVGHILEVRATYSGYSGYDYQKTPVVVGTPSTAQLSLSMNTSVSTSFYNVVVSLTLSDGTWAVDSLASLNNNLQSLITPWITLSGTPDVSTWTVTGTNPSKTWSGGMSFQDGKTIKINFSKSNDTNLPNPNLTVSLNSAKFDEIKNCTNVTGSISAGSPSNASSSAWK